MDGKRVDFTNNGVASGSLDKRTPVAANAQTSQAPEACTSPSHQLAWSLASVVETLVRQAVTEYIQRVYPQHHSHHSHPYCDEAGCHECEQRTPHAPTRLPASATLTTPTTPLFTDLNNTDFKNQYTTSDRQLAVSLISKLFDGPLFATGIDKYNYIHRACTTKIIESVREYLMSLKN